MTFRQIFRFEVRQQLASAWFWFILAALVLASFLATRDAALAEALLEDFFVNSPFSLAKVAVVGGLLWMVVGAAIAGEAAARDTATRMDPLVFTFPISRREYLGARFLAAFTLNAGLLLGVQLAAFAAIHAPGMDPVTIGPFRLATWVTNYGVLALPNAFFVTAVQFAVALRTGRPLS